MLATSYAQNAVLSTHQDCKEKSNAGWHSVTSRSLAHFCIKVSIMSGIEVASELGGRKGQGKGRLRAREQLALLGSHHFFQDQNSNFFKRTLVAQPTVSTSSNAHVVRNISKRGAKAYA